MATDPDKDVTGAIWPEAVAVILRRDPGGYYEAGGKWIKEDTTDETIQAAVQPTNAKALQDMPEGVRPLANYVIWAPDQVLMIDDVIVYDGDPFRVVHVWDRRREGGFTRAALGQIREAP